MSPRNVRSTVAAATILVAALFPSNTAALDPHKRVTQYVYDLWTVKDGLPINHVDSIAQTPDGYLWVSTGDELVRFDGVRFTVIDLRQTGATRIYVLMTDSTGALWIATDAGLVRRRHHSESGYTQFTRADGLLEYYVNSLYEDRAHNLWIATAGGLYRLAQGRITAYTTRDGLPHDTIQDVAESRDGTIWIGTNGGLARWKNGVITTYTRKEGLKHDLVLGLHEDRNGTLWISTFSGLSYRAADRIVSYSPSDGVPDVPIGRVVEDDAGSIWLPTYGSGLLRVYRGRVERFAGPQGLANAFLSQLLLDREGSLWIGTRGGGLARLKDGFITTYSVEEGLPHETVRGVMQDRDGTIWIATHGGGLVRFRDGAMTTLTTRDGLLNDTVFAMVQDRSGDLWVSSYNGGVNRIRSGRVVGHAATDLPQNQFIAAMMEDRSGAMWFALYGGGGLKRYEDGHSTTVGVDDGLSNSTVFALADAPDGSLWIGTRRGLNRLKDGKITRYLDQYIVDHLFKDRDGTIWAASGGGLVRVKGEQLTRYSIREGLGNESICSVLEDDNGRLWISGTKGIFRVEKRELAEFADGTRSTIGSVSYGVGDGLKTAECSGGTQPSAWRTTDGRLWFATEKGVAVLDPSRADTGGTAPWALMEEVTVEGQPLGSPGAVKAPTVEPGRRQFEFHYSAATLRAPGRVRFRYRIDGVDGRWVDAGARRIAYYSSLPPGRHRFRVIAATEGGPWNEDGAATFAFEVEPYIYQTWWFWSLCAATVAAGGWTAHRARLRRALDMERVRTRIASDLHDDIGSTLSQIAILSEVALTVAAGDTRVAHPLDRIARLSRESVDAMGDIVWAIDPHRDTAAHLATRIRRFASELLPPRGIDVRFELADPAGSHLPADVRREVYLILKEALNNVVRHADATCVNVSFRTSGRTLKIVVRDNGTGFDTAAEPSGHGLRNMRRRASSIGGQLDVSCAPGGGTDVTLTVHI